MLSADKTQSRQRLGIYASAAVLVILAVLYLLPVSVSGRVADADTGQPVPNAPVTVDGVQELRTDAEGRFSLQRFRLQPLAASIDAAGYQSWEGTARFGWLPLLPAALEANLAPTRLQGQTVDAVTGEPVIGSHLAVGDATATSDGAGQFELTHVPRQPVSVTIKADGYIDNTYHVEGNGPWDGSQPLPVKLLPKGLHGTMRDADTGQIIAGAVLRFGEQTVESDAQGFYYVEPPNRPNELSATAPGYLPAVVPVESEAALAGDEPLQLELSPTVLRGTVVDGKNGEPLPGAVIAAQGQTVVSDDAGEFRFERLNGDGLVLDAQLDGYEVTRQPVDEATNLLDGQPLQMTMLPRHLAGRVLNAVTDSPIAGATAVAGDITAGTDEEGRFRLWGAEPPLSIVVSANGFHDAETRFSARSELTVALDPRDSVVTVRDLTTGQPLVGTTLSGPRSQATTDAQGVALLPLIEPGESFTVTADGFATVTMVYGGSDQVDVELYPDVVAGRVADATTGTGVMGAVVYLYDGNTCQGLACRGTEPLAFVDAEADGSFRTDGLPQNAQVMVKAPGYDLFFAGDLQPGDCGAPYCLQAQMQPFEAQGFYIPFHYLYNRGLITQRLDLIAESPILNAVVVDMKSDFGEIAWDSQNPVAQEIGIFQPDVMTAQEFLEEARQRGIYTIARFVTFKDDALAVGRPDWALRKISSPDELWRDGENLAWVDPYRQEVREYQIELAKELAALGFDELQFDYFRFTGQRDHTQFTYSVPSTVENRREAITSFSRELMSALKPYGVFTAIDVFGSIILNGQEPLIGQNLADMAVNLDYMSPMIYPQVWWPGTFPGCDEPVLCPYKVIYDSVATVRDTVPMPTRIRPWLQGYPNNYRTSGPAAGYNYAVPEMMIQRQAAEDAGAEGWLFWSGGGNFPDEIFGELPSLSQLEAQVAARQGGGG